MPRRRHRGKEADSSPQFPRLSRRDFLKIALAGAGSLSLWGLIEAWDAYQLGQAEADARRDLLQVPDFSLSPEQQSSLASESWDDKLTIELQPEFASLSVDQQQASLLKGMSGMLNITLDRMRSSSYPPFRESVQGLDRNSVFAAELPTSGDGAIIYGHTVADPGVLFTTEFKVNPNGTWYTQLALNAPALDPRTYHPDPNFHSIINLAAGIAHEWSHYHMTGTMIDFFRQNTSDRFADIVDTVNQYPYQEPYAWAYSSAVVLPLMAIPSTAQSLATVFTAVATKWQETTSKNQTWGSPSWVNYIKGLGLTTPIM